MTTKALGFRTGDNAQAPRTLRRLVLHADDFGMNELVNAGILCGFSQGLLTSTSVLANAPACGAALIRWKDLQARFAHDNLPSLETRRRLADSVNRFDLGIHLNLTQGRPLTGDRFPPPLLDRDGLFPGVSGLAARLMKAGSRHRRAIENELCAQIEVLVDGGIAPTHLNAHQYVDVFPSVAAMIPELLRRYAIPVVRVPWETHLTQTTLVRRFQPANWCLAQVKRLFAFRYLVAMRRSGIPHPAAFFGTSHAGRIDFDLMQTFVAAAGPGVTEIGMHPGIFDPTAAGEMTGDGWSDPLAAVRADELSLLTSPELAQLLERQQIRLARLSELTDCEATRAAA
ncbi:MAG: carbohydrate deacetylase [Deltaproteobacteria bacterium]